MACLKRARFLLLSVQSSKSCEILLERTFRLQSRSTSTQWHYEAHQLKQLNDKCILVDELDSVVGVATKKDCHWLGDKKLSRLHRAFSVFIFNGKKELLLQQRAESKITFPDYFTNSCCSHPRYSDEEMVTEGRLGIKRAAVRRLNYELGIPSSQISISDLKFITRVHYAAPADGCWGEHEIDYVLFLQKDLDLNINKEEVKSVRFVDVDGLQEVMNKAYRKELKVTPWFTFIAEKLLPSWWQNLDKVDMFVQNTVIHRGPLVEST